MRKTTLFVLFLAGLQQATAQTDRLETHHRQLNQWLQHQQQSLRAETRSATERVIGQSTYSGSGSITDSSKVVYDLNGTSVYDYNTMVYAYNYPYSTSPMFNNYMGTSTQPQVLFTQHDRWTIDPNTLVYGFYQRDLAGYDPYQNLSNDTILYADSSMYSNMIYANDFDPSGKIIKGSWLNWSSGVADSAFKQYFEYDGSGQLLKDSLYEMHLGTWRLAAKTFYTYDGSGNPVFIDHYANNNDTSFTQPLIEQLTYQNTFDGSNRLLTTFTSYFDGVALSPYIKDSFDYTGGLGFHTTWREDQYDPINLVWTPYQKMTKNLNTDDVPNLVNIYSWDMMSGWVPFSKYVITYNSQIDPLTLKEYIYDFTGFPSTPDYTTRYYYESTSIPTGLNETTESKNISIYPNPATQQVTIDLGKNFDRSASIKLMDLEGKLVMSRSVSTQTVQCDLSHLEKGIYLLQVLGTQVNECRKLVKE